MSSIWNDVSLPKFPSLDGDISTNTVIIGGGLAGLLTARRLTDAGVENIVIDANTVCSGQTQNTTAKITSQHSLKYSKILKYYGREAATQYAKANESAIRCYENIIEERNIECDFEKKNAFLYSKSSTAALQEEMRAAKSAGIDCYFTDKTELPFSVSGALAFKNQAQFHPLKFISGITDGLTVYENTPAVRVEGNCVITHRGRINAKNIVVASGYPFINFPGMYFLKMSRERSYVIALEGAECELSGMYKGVDKSSLSLRGYKDYILLGGGAHRTGENDVDDVYAMLEKEAQGLFKNAVVKEKWTAEDCITLDGIPYIGTFSKKSKNIFVATGFGKWGMTSSMVSANIISDMISGKDNPYKEVFNPCRLNIAASAKDFLENTGETVKSFVSHLCPPECKIEMLKKNASAEVEYEGKKVGAYRDNDGKIYLVTLKCPHLKCKLKFNNTTKSWECPCHGSRYDFKGNIIDGPSQARSILVDVLES